MRENQVAEIMRWMWTQDWFQSKAVFPSARSIAQVYGASLRQTLRALHEFSRMGFIQITHGGKIVPVQDIKSEIGVQTPKARIASSIKVLARLREGIASAEFRSGDILPKAAWLCKEWKVSTRSLSAACQILAQENLLRKEGKSWRVGSSLKNLIQTSSAKERPVILVASVRPEEWAEFHVNLMDGLVRTLGSEADRCGVQLMPVQFGSNNAEAVFPVGKSEIRTLIRSLGHRYRGCLLTPLRESLTDFDSWCEWFCRQGKPVIWLQDDKPDLPVISSPRFHRVNYGNWVLGSMDHATELAIRSLAELGHRYVLFPCHSPDDFPWFRQRALQLEEAAKCHSVNLMVLESHGPLAEVTQWIRKNTAITALIAPNDHWAIHYWKELHSSGVRIPQDISLLSFDNVSELKPYPIATIDFGMSLLGYRIFHCILGDVPIKCSAPGRLVGQCQLINNGSLAKARLTNFNNNNV